MRKTDFQNGEFYHLYNRGVDKRSIFTDNNDFSRFLQSMDEFNVIEPIGSIYENSFIQKIDKVMAQQKLVRFVSYCLNANHYHFLVEQVSDQGIEKFMHRLSTGYTKYFNSKFYRTGSLFQGRYKAKYVDSNKYLLYLSSYINLNNQVHRLGSSTSKSSWEEFVWEDDVSNFCHKNIILDQFKNKNEYKLFAEEALQIILSNRETFEEVEFGS